MIEEKAKAILAEREKHVESGATLAQLYDAVNIKTTDMYKYHYDLDRAVMKLYGFSAKDTTEAKIVATLIERYQALVREQDK